MGNVRYPSSGPKAWKALFGAHQIRNAVTEFGESNNVGALMRELKIPGDYYEHVPKRGNT